MAIQSWGYKGTIAPNDVWANMQMALGSRYFVADWGSAKVTPLAGGTREIQVSSGFLGGWGVLDQVTDPVILPLPEVPSGVRFFPIYLRRTWQSSQRSTIEYGNALTSLPAALPERFTVPGTVDDQPLALVSVAAGSTTPTVIYDLRVIGGKDFFCMDPAVPTSYFYLDYPGVKIRTGYTEYTNRPGPNASHWQPDPMVVRSGPGQGNPLGISGNAGWNTVSELVTTGTRTRSGVVQLYCQARRSGANISFSTTQGQVAGGDRPVMSTSNADWRPPYTIMAPVTYYSSNASCGGWATMDASGQITLIGGMPGTTLTRKSSGVSFQVNFTWTKDIT